VGEAADDRSLPLGYCPEAVRATALLEADAAIHDQPHHRSHVTSWLRAEGRSRALDLPADWPRRPEWRWTIDTTADLEAARAAFALFGGAWPQIGYPDMVARLEGHPEVVAINAGVRQKLLSEG
jgi:spore coat polysaccharide biosynthesis protein SpsF (cytidylyltransferase family)